MTSVGIGPGVREVREKNQKIPLPRVESDDDDEKDLEAKTTDFIGVDPLTERPKKVKEKVLLLPAGTMSKRPSARTRSLKLSEITGSLPPEHKASLMLKASQRIMNCEKAANIGGIPSVRTKIISTLGARFSIMSKSALVAYIFQDFSKRIDIAFSWLYEEYCFYQGFHKNSTVLCRRGQDDSEYNSIFCTLIRGVIERTDGKERENLLRRLYLESPIITEDAIELLKSFITIMGSAIVIVNLMKDLVMRRPTKKLNCLNFLLEFCYHDLPDVRKTAISTVLQLHAERDFKNIIEEYAKMYLKFLLQPGPPELLFTEDRGRPEVISVWMEDTVRVCLYLFLDLLPENQGLLKDLADVYITAETKVYALSNATRPSVKSIILRELDGPISKIPMDSPGLLDLLELDSWIKGSETLIMKIVNILTDKATPSPELVEKVKILYEEKVEDVRFLIPVLTGLSKREIIQTLPKLIQLSAPVVKTSFNRLLNTTYQKTPDELLIALHNLADPELVRSVVQATNLCFKEKSVYTQEVLITVLFKLLDQTNIPILFMRTVLQSLSMYPSMIQIVINILSKLIGKQVWKQKDIWKGFIMSCEKTMPQSYAIMLQLPPPQLAQFLEEAPQIREPLLLHVQNFNESQRAHVSARTMKVLYNDYIVRDDTEENEGDHPPGEDPMAPLD